MKRSTTAILVLFLFATGLFASGVDLTGVGVRATTLGGNYRAVSNDWSGMFWNPAGLVFSKGLKVGTSVEFITPTVGYSAFPYKEQPFSALSTDEIKNEAKTFLMPAFGIYYSNEKMAYGLGFWAPFGLGAKWNVLNTATYNSAYPEYDFEDDLKVIALQPTFAYKLADNLSAGVGLTFLMADIMIRKPNFTMNPVAFDPAYAALKTALGASAAAPYNYVLTESNMEGDGMGFGATIGLQWKPLEALTLGASAKYYDTISLEGTLSADTYYPVGPANVKPTLDYLLSVSAISAGQYQQLMGLYSGATVAAIPKMKIKADMPLPMNFGIGFAFTGVKNLLVTGDVALSQWSSWDVITINDEADKMVSELTENWENSLRMGLGLEYSLGFAKLRGAFYTEQRAAIDETMTITIPDVNDRNVVILGIGVPIGPLNIGVMYEKILIGDYEVADWAYTAKGFENMAGKYTMDVYNIMVGIDYNL